MDVKKQIKLGPKMVQFRMKSMLMTFRDKFYIYKETAKEKNLTTDDIVHAIGDTKWLFLSN
eukprot:3118775-Ditylum_brightwellii.AAC.1